MRSQSYPSDITDEQWALIKPHIPIYPGGRSRKTNMRDAVDAIFYLLRTGCQWRYLPKDFPPKSTVWRYFDEWRQNGTLDDIHDMLRKKVRTQEKPYSPRTTASVDSQSVDTTSGGQQRGRDNAKNVDGRKRHIVVDSLGLLLAVLVTAASVDDAKAAQELFPRLEGQPVGKVVRMFADSKYHNFALYEWVENNARWDLVIVRRPDGAKGWVKLPVRWTVERTFAWLGHCRRLTTRRHPETTSTFACFNDWRSSVEQIENWKSFLDPSQGPRENRAVVGGIRQVGHDPLDDQSVGTQGNGCRVPLPIGCLNRPYGTVTDHMETPGSIGPLGPT